LRTITTTTGLRAENNTTPRPLQYMKSKERDVELYHSDEETTPLTEVYKRI
jgi:hypothetical protein